MPVRFAGFPASSPASVAATHGATRTRSQGRQRKPAPRMNWRSPTTPEATAGDDPQEARRSSRSDRGIAALLTDPERELGRDVQAAAGEVERRARRAIAKATPRMRASRSGAPGGEALAAGRRPWASGAVMGVGVGPAVIRTSPGTRRDADATSGGGLATLTRQIVRISPGAATNMMTSAMMKSEQVERDPRLRRPSSLPPFVSAPNSSAARTTPLGRRPASRASAMALNPMPPERSRESWPTVPMTRKPPAMPAEAARDGHREHHRAAGAHARVACRGQVEARCAELEALRRPEQEPRDDATAMSSATTKPVVEPDGRQGDDQSGRRRTATGPSRPAAVLPGCRRASGSRSAKNTIELARCS